MKKSVKKIIALLSAASLLFLGACSDKPVNTPENNTVEVTVDDFTAEFIFNENGLIEKEKKFYDNQEITYEYYECYEYNEKNQITKRYATDLDGNILEKHDLFEMVYNESGNIGEITEDKIRHEFIYDENGKLKTYNKYENNELAVFKNYEYDENGNRTKEIQSATDKNSSETTAYTYDGNGLVISSTTENASGVITNNSSYEYNADGLVTKLTKEKSQETRTTVYEYENGVLVKEKMTIAPKDGSVETRTREYVTSYEYLAEGKVVKFSRERNGEIYMTDAYSLDEAKGNFADLNSFISL
ncbi:MAG: hypothetical protein IJZ07_00865 [Clostridia bacterium]|nr:hypothetical protein [Clostridia bacterium]